MTSNVNIPYGESRPAGSNRAVTTGEFRPPLKGEWYASGAVIEAYMAPNDLSFSYWICVPVPYKPISRTLELAVKIGEQQPPIHKEHGTI
jgi:hypothetical protein